MSCVQTLPPRLALIEPQAKTECCPLSIFSHVSYVCFISSYLNFNLSTSPQNPPDGLTSGRWLLHLPSSLDSPVQSSGFPQGPRGSRITGVGAEQDPCTTSSLSPFFFLVLFVFAQRVPSTSNQTGTLQSIL